MKIYTRTGDKGTTGLFGGKRVGKDDVRIEAIGSIDELNSAIGLAIAEISNIKNTYSSSDPPAGGESRSKKDSSRPIRQVQGRQARTINSELTKIQGDLFEIGAVLASPNTKYKILDTKNLHKRVEEFEDIIDSLTKKIPELRNFILPGGSKEGAMLHLARSISRRTERQIVALAKKEPVEGEALAYINRLSDLLFTMARFVNKQNKILETSWKGLP